MMTVCIFSEILIKINISKLLFLKKYLLYFLLTHLNVLTFYEKKSMHIGYFVMKELNAKIAEACFAFVELPNYFISLIL